MKKKITEIDAFFTWVILTFWKFSVLELPLQDRSGIFAMLSKRAFRDFSLSFDIFAWKIAKVFELCMEEAKT